MYKHSDTTLAATGHLYKVPKPPQLTLSFSITWIRSQGILISSSRGKVSPFTWREHPTLFQERTMASDLELLFLHSAARLSSARQGLSSDWGPRAHHLQITVMLPLMSHTGHHSNPGCVLIFIKTSYRSRDNVDLCWTWSCWFSSHPHYIQQQEVQYVQVHVGGLLSFF